MIAFLIMEGLVNFPKILKCLGRFDLLVFLKASISFCLAVLVSFMQYKTSRCPGSTKTHFPLVFANSAGVNASIYLVSSSFLGSGYFFAIIELPEVDTFFFW